MLREPKFVYPEFESEKREEEDVVGPSIGVGSKQVDWMMKWMRERERGGWKLTTFIFCSLKNVFERERHIHELIYCCCRRRHSA